MYERMSGDRDITAVVRNAVEMQNKRLIEVRLEQRQARNMRDWRMRKGLEVSCERRSKPQALRRLKRTAPGVWFPYCSWS